MTPENREHNHIKTKKEEAADNKPEEPRAHSAKESENKQFVAEARKLSESKLMAPLALSEAKYQKLSDEVKEERFLWIIATIIVFDAHVFPSLNGWGLVAILALEMILVLVLARRLGIEDVASFMEKIMASFAGFVKNKAKRP